MTKSQGLQVDFRRLQEDERRVKTQGDREAGSQVPALGRGPRGFIFGRTPKSQILEATGVEIVRTTRRIS